jgi:hypothetical protein
MRIALSTHKQLCKVNVKKQQNDPRHETPHLGRPVPPPYSWLPLLPSPMSSSKKTRNVSKKKARPRPSGSTNVKSSSRSNHEAASSQLAMVSMFGAARAYPRARTHCRCSCPSRNCSPVPCYFLVIEPALRGVPPFARLHGRRR